MKPQVQFMAALYIVVSIHATVPGETTIAREEPKSLPAPVAPVKGRLCLSEERDCTSTSGLQFEVPPSEMARRYVWMSDDYRTIFAGDLRARATMIDLESKETPWRTISLGVRGHASRSWPADAVLTIWESREKEWKWQLPSEAAGRELNIHLPVKNYVLFIQAPRHYKLGRRLPAEEDLALGTIVLQPLPSIRGRVVALQEERVGPVVGAQIVFGDGKVGGATNEQGLFDIELGEPVTKEIVVASTGFGTRVMKLERLDTENDLGDIRLESGVRLTLQIERPKDLREKPLRVRLLRHDDSHDHSLVALSELAAGEDEPRFPDLSPGQYYVVVEGADPLERILLPLEIGEEDVTKLVQIRPFRLKGRVLLGEEPLRRGEIEIKPIGAAQKTWRVRLKIEDEGRFGAVLWQTGRLIGFIHGHGADGILSNESPELGSDPSVWTMSFKNRVIHGRIFDAESGAAAQEVGFELKTTAQDGGGSRSSVSVATNGDYRILAWRDGTYDLIVSARDYLAETKTIELTEMEGSKEVDFGLKRGEDAKLEFFWSTGQKIFSPNIYEGVARDGRHPERQHRTDAAGILRLSVPPDTSRLLYVLPQEGSFAPVRVTARRSSDDDPIRVEIPPGSGTLRVRVKNREKPVTDVSVMMRYNGEWIPYSMTSRLRNNTAEGLVEFLALPAGLYELWAVQLREGQVPPNTPPPHAPVRVGVAVGKTDVEVPLVVLP